MGLELEALPLISKISRAVIRILGCNAGPITLQGTNTYLVGTGTRRVLIDAGDVDTAPKYTEVLGNVLKQEQATIEHLIITHWHSDHIGGVSEVQKLLQNAKPATIWKLPRAVTDNSFRDIENTLDLKLLQDEQVIEVEGAKLRVKHTPGHATDHACLVLDDGAALFSGDCILGQGSAVFEDLYTYMQSLHKILSLNPQQIYPGHGPVVSAPTQKIQEYIDHRNRREQQILDVVREKGPATEEDITEILYKDLTEGLKQFAVSNVFQHLKKLAKEGKVSQERGMWKCVKSQL